MRILIAEDDVTSRWLLERVLKRWNHEIVSAESGTQALDLLQAQDSPQLAILDWLMPGLTGVEVCRELRKNPGVIDPSKSGIRHAAFEQLGRYSSDNRGRFQNGMSW